MTTGLDPARHRAQVQDAVERQKVIAFVQNNEPFTGQGSLDYLEQKRVPVIGTDTGSAWAYDSPMYFPQTASADLIFKLGIWGASQQLIPVGKKKIGTVVCVEGESCNVADRTANKTAKKAGMPDGLPGEGVSGST